MIQVSNFPRMMFSSLIYLDLVVAYPKLTLHTYLKDLIFISICTLIKFLY